MCESSFDVVPPGRNAETRSFMYAGYPRDATLSAMLTMRVPDFFWSAQPSQEPGVTYRKSMSTFITSWLPMRMCTAPPAAAACRFRWNSQSTHDFSLSPRSMISPSWTKWEVPPIQSPASFTIFAMRRHPSIASTSPCTSPTATTRSGISKKVGTSMSGVPPPSFFPNPPKSAVQPPATQRPFRRCPGSTAPTSRDERWSGALVAAPPLAARRSGPSDGDKLNAAPNMHFDTERSATRTTAAPRPRPPLRGLCMSTVASMLAPVCPLLAHIRRA
mmetsp:Transcript_71716/g.164332  ORF Transcript_71716/g.164332 Transcript_71716/m.164332 type:complete len:274 (+) Transcript_71716:2340-3161(+)